MCNKITEKRMRHLIIGSLIHLPNMPNLLGFKKLASYSISFAKTVNSSA